MRFYLVMSDLFIYLFIYLFRNLCCALSDYSSLTSTTPNTPTKGGLLVEGVGLGHLQLQNFSVRRVFCILTAKIYIVLLCEVVAWTITLLWSSGWRYFNCNRTTVTLCIFIVLLAVCPCMLICLQKDYDQKGLFFSSNLLLTREHLISTSGVSCLLIG